MKKWMVVIALLATSQVAAKNMSIEHGVNAYDDRFNDAPADKKMAHSLIKKAYELYDAGIMGLFSFYKVVNFVTKYIPKNSLSDDEVTTDIIANSLYNLGNGKTTEKALSQDLDVILAP